MLIKRAQEEGLLNPKNGITKKDIMGDIPPGWDFYGIGP
jgi:hypothetical protein